MYPRCGTRKETSVMADFLAWELRRAGLAILVSAAITSCCTDEARTMGYGHRLVGKGLTEVGVRFSQTSDEGIMLTFGHAMVAAFSNCLVKVSCLDLQM